MPGKIVIQYSDPSESTQSKKNTYILQKSEKINKMKQMVIITAIRNHSLQGLWSSFPNEKKRKKNHN